jgi:cytochrome b561
MAALKAVYKRISDHIGKIMAIAGTLVTTVATVLTDNASVIEESARTYLTVKWLHYIGIALFALLLLRTTWAGIQNTKLKQQLEDAKK